MSERSNEQYVDTDAALMRIRGNKKVYQTMLQLFLDCEEFEALEKSLSEKDYEKAAEVAHGIKGMTGNLSMPLLFKVSTDLNEELKNGEPNQETLADYREILAKTESLVKNIMETL